jgi:hypothetical protein
MQIARSLGSDGAYEPQSRAGSSIDQRRLGRRRRGGHRRGGHRLGSTDAGSADAGSTDAESADSGSADAESADAESADAGAPTRGAPMRGVPMRGVPTRGPWCRRSCSGIRKEKEIRKMEHSREVQGCEQSVKLNLAGSLGLVTGRSRGRPRSSDSLLHVVVPPRLLGFAVVHVWCTWSYRRSIPPIRCGSRVVHVVVPARSRSADSLGFTCGHVSCRRPTSADSMWCT